MLLSHASFPTLMSCCAVMCREVRWSAVACRAVTCRGESAPFDREHLVSSVETTVLWSKSPDANECACLPKHALEDVLRDRLVQNYVRDRRGPFVDDREPAPYALA